MTITMVTNTMVDIYHSALVLHLLTLQTDQAASGQQGHPQDQKGKRRGHDSEEGSETFSDFTMRSDTARAADMDYYGRGDEQYEGNGQRGYRPPSSQVSYGGNRSSGASTPVYGADFSNALPLGQRSKEPYPAWTSETQVPVSKEEIEDIFLDLVNKFGFQRDSMRNIYDFFMVLLDSIGPLAAVRAFCCFRLSFIFILANPTASSRSSWAAKYHFR